MKEASTLKEPPLKALINKRFSCREFLNNLLRKVVYPLSIYAAINKEGVSEIDFGLYQIDG